MFEAKSTRLLLHFFEFGGQIVPNNGPVLLGGTLAAAACGFLVWNWSPAKLFLGDVGSIPLGYLIGWLMVGAGLFTFALALQPMPADKFLYIATAYPVAFCVSVLTFIVPSGLGTRDATLATAIDAVLPLTVATAIAVAFRILQTVIELMFVGALAWLARRKRSPS